MTPYSTRYASREEIPKFKIPEKGAPAEAVRRMLRDDLDLDGIPNLNMARSVIIKSSPRQLIAAHFRNLFKMSLPILC